MGKQDREPKGEKKAKGSKKTAKDAPKSPGILASQVPVVTSNEKYVDEALASLFASSAGPITVPKKSKAFPPNGGVKKSSEEAELSASGPDSPGTNGAEAEEPDSDAEDHGVENQKPSSRHNNANEPSQRSRKRKRGDADDNLEQLYMERLAREEAKDTLKTSKLAKVAETGRGDESSGAEGTETEDQNDEVDEADSAIEPFSPPQHESKTEENAEIEKASRTVFLGNVSTQAIVSKTAKKELLRHLASFFSSLSSGLGTDHTVESIRFRSTAYSTKLPKKAAFAKKDLMEATTKSTNAYAVYSTKLAAREAVKQLNGTVVLDRHIHVDQVAHPTKTDHRRCVFVGNLDFVDDDSQIREANEYGEEKKRKKNKVPGDVEEGLWRQFGKAGTVESIRVPRDPKTRVGKGFAYVQFVDENAVEAALLFNDKTFPPLLPRKLRVSRAKSVKRNDPKNGTSRNPKAAATDSRVPNRSMQGRARKLLGRAGATQLRRGEDKPNKRQKNEDKSIAPPESFIFEGHRARSNQGHAGFKLGGSGKRKGKPKTRSSKRGAAWKAARGKKDK